MVNAQEISLSLTNKVSVKPIFYGYPKSLKYISDFNLNQFANPFIPLNGGIYLPFDTAWYLTPSKSRCILTSEFNLKDTCLNAVLLDQDSCRLYTIKFDKKLNAKFHIIQSFEKGSYYLRYKKGSLYIWGRSNAHSRIGIVTIKSGIKWIVDIPETITALEIGENGDVLFSVANKIYNLTSNKVILKINTNILGFCLNNYNKIILSTEKGLFQVESNKLSLILSGIDGPIKSKGQNIYLLSNKYNVVCKILVE